MKWLKMRTMWAWGYTKWKYKPLYVEKINKKTEEWVQNIIEMENDEHSWSDKYRRVEYDIINTRKVPNSKILETCENIERSLDHAKKSISTHIDHLIKVKGLDGKGRKTDPDEVETAKRKAKYKAVMAKRKKEKGAKNGII